MRMILFSFILSLNAWARPSVFEDLLPYVIQAPDQGETNTCLFVASTGVMEIILNKKFGLVDQQAYDRFDLTERYLISTAGSVKGHPWHMEALLKFNVTGEAITQETLPFSAWDGSQINWGVWNYPSNFPYLPRIQVPKIEYKTLFIKGKKWATNVLNDADIELMKEMLWKYKEPILVNYNDEGYWHVVVIVGYNDTLKGDCYDTDPSLCRGLGSFYVRDSFGVKFEVRDTDWFKIKGNAAFVVREKVLGRTW